jgi:hypothetical protein
LPDAVALLNGLLVVGVVIDVTGASQRDLIMREFAAFWYRRSLGVRIGPRFLGRPRDLVDICRMNAVDWWDHGVDL